MADVPMEQDKGKGALAPVAEQPWSEKYRPQSLDEVAAHKDIIDTSKLRRMAQQCPLLDHSHLDHGM